MRGVEKEIERLEREEEELKRLLKEMNSQIPGIANGSIKVVYVKCGRKWCSKCPHGPYYYLQWKENGKVKTKYLGKNEKFKEIADKVREIKKRLKEVEKKKKKLLSLLNIK